MSITSIASLYFRKRQRELEQHFAAPLELQEKVLSHLTSRAANTIYGREHGIAGSTNYETFRRFVSVNTYEELKDYIDRMRHGEKNVLWPVPSHQALPMTRRNLYL